MNSVNIIGNLTGDPELRATRVGTAVLSFGVAVNESVKGQDGEWTDRANYFDVCMFGKRGEALGRILHKGDKVGVDGRLRYSSWEKDGQRRSKVDIVADDIDLMQRKTDKSDDAPSHDRPSVDPPAADVYDEDIPF